jgi:beta-galactosidase/beta-glucuronidase
LLLHFGAVDYESEVWINGHVAGHHEGGYTPFTFDVTDEIQEDGPQELVVHAIDDPHDLTKPRGKQDWQLESHSIWYPRTTGIWQEVWLEPVPATRIGRVRWAANLERWEIAIECMIEGERTADHSLYLRLTTDHGVLADDRYRVIAGEVNRRIALSDPGIDDFRNELLWRPDSPTLIDAVLTLYDGEGTEVDRVHGYTALRTVGVQGDRFVLNGRPIRLRMVLDQGYWPESGLTPPDPPALRRDIELAMAMGFNGVRKHQKLEDPRYLAYADALGMLVWGEMPSIYRFTRRAVSRLSREWMDAIERDSSHPCLVAWVPFNESWGVPDLPDNPAQRDCVRALYHLTKTLDQGRPVIGNDGWESTATDIIGIHDYDADTARLARRYAGSEVIPNLFRDVLPSGRLVAIEGFAHQGQPLMLTEFGGIAFTSPERQNTTWGYHRSDNAEEFARDLAELLETIRSSTIFAGFCYTQFADTYQEANGLLYADRTPKIPLRQIARAVLGHGPEETPLEPTFE